MLQKPNQTLPSNVGDRKDLTMNFNGPYQNKFILHTTTITPSISENKIYRNSAVILREIQPTIYEIKKKRKKAVKLL